MQKDFDSCHIQKKKINATNSTPTISERDVWWCRLGVNIWHEQDGKGEQSQRPILIIAKFNRRICWTVPLTTQVKDNRHYHYFEFLNKPQCALLSQMTLIDVSRLNKKMGRLDDVEFNNIRTKLKLYLS